MPTAVDYDPNMSVLAARTRYFADNNFGEDGGYGAKWVTLAKLGPLELGFPNSAARLRAVRLHDLHHLVTGYDTDWIGEAEIAAWELASGCADYHAAWVLNLLAMPIGVLREPDRIRRAFVRGSRSRNLYDKPFDEAVLDQRLGELRARLDVASAANATMTAAERARFRRMLAIGMLGQLAVLAVLTGLLVALVLVVIWLVGR